MHILYKWHHELTNRWNWLYLPWRWFSSFSPLFWLFLHLRWKVMDQCSIHGYESMQKLDVIAVKYHWTLLKSPHGFVFVRLWINMTPIFLISKFSVNMWCTAPFKMPTKSVSSCTFCQESCNISLWFSSPILAWSPYLVDHCNVCLGSLYGLIKILPSNILLL